VAEVDSLVVRVNLDGTGFQNGISNINRQLRVVQSEFQAAAAKIGDFGNSTEKLGLKADALSKQIELQKQKVAALQGALNQSIEAKGRDVKATQELEIKLNKARATLANMENELRKTNAELENQSSTWAKFSNTIVSSTDKAKNSFMSLGEVIKSSLAFGAVYQGLALVKQGFDAVVGGGIQFNANMQENEIAFTQMLGSAEKAKAMLADLTQFAATTPFELPQVEDAAKKLLAFGFQAEQIRPMLTAIGDAAAGLGLGAAGIDRITLALGQMQAKTKVQSDEMLQLVEAGIPAWDILSKAMGVPTAQLQKMVSDGVVPADKAIQALVAGMEQRFPHMMDAQSKSFSGLMSNLKDNLSQTFGTIMKPTFDWLTNVALPKAVELTTNFTNALKTGGIGEALKTIMPADAANTIVEIGNKIKDAFGFIKDHGEEIKSVVLSIGAAFMTYKTITGIIDGVKAAQMALNVVMEMNPFIAIASAVVAVGVLIYTHWDQIKSFLSQTWNSIKSVAESAWNGIANFFSSTWANLKAFFAQWGPTILSVIAPFIGIPLQIYQHWDQIKAYLAQAWESIKNGVSTAFNNIGNAIMTAWNGVTSFFQSVWNNIYAVFQAAWNVIGPYVMSVWNSLKQYFSALWTSLVEIVSFGWQSIKDFFGASFDTIKQVVATGWENIKAVFAAVILTIYDLVTGKWDEIKEVWRAAINLIAENTSAAWEKIKEIWATFFGVLIDNVNETWARIKDAWNSAFNALKDTATLFWEGIKSVFTNAWNNLVQVVVNLWNGIKQAFSNAIEAVKQTVVNMWDAITSFFAAAPGRIVAFVTSLWNSVQSAFSSAVQTVISTVSSMWNSIVSFFQSAPGRIMSALQSLWSSITSTFQSIASDAASAGSDVVRGFINGIWDLASWAYNEITSFFGSVVDWAKKVLHINSPSRVFMEIGQYITEGLAVGIQNGTGQAVDATTRMVNAVKDAASKISNELSYSAQLSQAKFDLMKAQMEDTAGQIDKLRVQYQALSEQLDVQRDKVALLEKEYEYMATIKGQDAEETKNLYLELLKEQKAQADLEKQLRDTTRSMEDQKKQLQDLIQQAKDAEDKYYNDLAAAAEEYQQKVAQTNQKLADNIQKTWDDFEKQVESRANSLKNFVGLFDAVQPKQVSGTDLLKNLQDQVNAFEDWQKNIAALSKRGVDEGLVAELKQMGPKAGPEIAALNTLTDDQLKQYVSLWKQKSQDARTEAENELEQQRIDTLNKIADLRIQAEQQLEQYRIEWQKKNETIRKNAMDEMNKIEQKYQEITKNSTKYGVDLVQNFIGGIRSQFEALRQTLEDMTSMVDAYMPHSPAKVGPLKRLGEWGPGLVNTFADGIVASMPKLESVINRMAALTPAALQPALAGVANSTTNNYGGNTFYIQVSGGGNASNLADDLMRELRRRGVRS
jgi:tape measure domain-containing protein